LGQRPGTTRAHEPALKARFIRKHSSPIVPPCSQSLSKVVIHIASSCANTASSMTNVMCGIEATRARLSRAFSAHSDAVNIPGALPQAGDEAAPLALNRYRSLALPGGPDYRMSLLVLFPICVNLRHLRIRKS
jgi:hypothetical protein